MPKINIFWFRRDLRIEDNIGLFHCGQSDLSFLPIFIFDKNILDKLEDKKDHRLKFIHENLQKIKGYFNELGSDLRVYYGDPLEVWSEILTEFKVEAVFANEDYEPYAISRDQKVEKLLKDNQSILYAFKDQCIFAKNDVLKKDGKPYTVYTAFKNNWLDKVSPKDIASFDSKKYLTKSQALKKQKMMSIAELGFEDLESTFPERVIKKKIINEYTEQRNFPAICATTKLGIHLRFGSVSVRKCVQAAMLSEDKMWLSELIWREFFMQILYHFPHVELKAFKPKYENIKWNNSRPDFEKWCQGKTGYPIVDAGMRELNATGFMHNRVRMVVASFLVKHLLIDWRWGEKYFAQKLFDFDLSANNGNWQWVAGTGCDAAPYFRIFNPKTQQEKFDPDFIYIKKWVPEFETQSYPLPMIEHKYAYDRALVTYKTSLA